MDKNIDITYKSCGIDDIEEFYKEKFAHNVSYDIQNQNQYEYNILNLKQMYIYDYIKANSKVLDFGCGSGTYKILKKLDCHIVGVDLSKKAIQNALELNSYDEAYALDIFDIFFDQYKNSFDYVISSDVFGHIEFKDKDKVIERLKYLLKEDGTMIHGIETGDIKYNDMTPQERFNFVSVDGHVGMESEEKTTSRFQNFFKNVNTYTPYGIMNDLDEIIKQNESYDVSVVEPKLINYLKQNRENKIFKDAFNISQYCTHKAYESNTKLNSFLNLYGFSFLISSDNEIIKYSYKKPQTNGTLNSFRAKSTEPVRCSEGKATPGTLNSFRAKAPNQFAVPRAKPKKIAIIAPSPVPFGVGGAEKLWWGMQEYINKHTLNQCELIKIPTKENNFWDLIESYHRFYTLDLSHFDMVISTKYPAWMVQHKNHHIYLQHCLRGLYDTYHFSKQPTEVKSNHPAIKNTIKLLQDKTTTIKKIFESIFKLKDDSTIPQEIYNFPAPFIRLIIHVLDNKTMQNVKSFSAISNTVINRKEYFPKDAVVQKIYHPSNLTKFENNSYDYFFTASRLDGAKRIKMIVEAYMLSSTTIPLKIAGSGPLEQELKQLAKDDKKIEFLGFISDDELMQHYSNSYAVLFVPYDEDFGLITIEAAMSEKPILTFSDSGGVVEFVEHNITGLVCEPNVKKLSKNIEYISQNKDLAISMGKEVKKRVQNITWKHTIESLLQQKYSGTLNLFRAKAPNQFAVPRTKQNGTLNLFRAKGTEQVRCSEGKSTPGTLNLFRAKAPTDPLLKITVVTTYPIYPPRGGGQNRVFYLYKELAKTIKVDVICLVNENETYKSTQVAPNLFEIRVPKSQAHAKKESDMEIKAGIPITDIAMLYLYDETSAFKSEIEKSYATSTHLIATQPYTYKLCKSITLNKIIHDSQNVEYTLKKQMLKDTSYNKELLKKVYEAEKESTLDALITTVCSFDDALNMEELYNFDMKKAVIIPNGVDLNTVPYISPEKRERIKIEYGFANQKIVLFIGSWHQPNIDAVYEIFEMAKKLPDYKFIIMGSVGKYFQQNQISNPKNIGFTGITTDKEKELYLSIADIAINPMLTGSGTNLKMLDYMANGIPVISTKIGARGLNIPAKYIVECGITEFPKFIKEIQSFVDVEKSRIYVEENFSWKVIQNSLKIMLS